MQDASADRGCRRDDSTPSCLEHLAGTVTAALEPAPIPAVLVCLRSRCLAWHNSAARDAGGEEHASLLKDAPAESLVAPDDRPRIRALLDAFERGEIDHHRGPANLGATEHGEWELTLIAVDHAPPGAGHLLVYGRRRRPEQRWEGINAHHLEQLGDPVNEGRLAALLTDGSGVIQSVSETACALFGRSADRLLDARLPDFLGDPETGEELLRSAQEATGRSVSGWVTISTGDTAGETPVPRRRVAVAVTNRLGEPPIDALLWHKLPIEEPPINAARRAHTSEYAAFLERRLAQIAREVERAGLVIRSHGAPPARLLPGLERLSDREREVLDLLARGLRVPTIAERLFVSQSTVRNHVSALFRKLGVQSQAELIERVLDPEGDDQGS